MSTRQHKNKNHPARVGLHQESRDRLVVTKPDGITMTAWVNQIIIASLESNMPCSSSYVSRTITK